MASWRQRPGNGASHQPEESSLFGDRLDQARQGDSDALSALYRQFLPGIFGYIAARVPDRATAEDLTSEVFLKMVEGIHRLRATEEASFAAWLLQIARITVAGYYRKHASHPVLVSLSATSLEGDDDESGHLTQTIAPLAVDPAYQAEAREEWQEVVAAINALTEEQRQVLVSRLLLGYDVDTVGRMLGKKGNAVKALQFRALQSLHRLLHRQPAFRPTLPSQRQRQGGPL
jgi:RNA polymerase sigma-70 factor (ECF subfamily)